MRYPRRFKRRKRIEEEQSGHERWLLTYADMITLLLGLFIILYSISTVDRKKLDSVAEAIRVGFGFGDRLKVAIFEGSDSLVDEELFKPRSPVYRLWENLGYNLKRWKEAAQIRLGLSETEELKLILFAPVASEGDWVIDDIQDETYKNLSTLSTNLDIEIIVRLEIPEVSGSSRTSWEDSARKTARLAEILETQYKIPRDKIAILAHTRFNPLPETSVNSPESRAKQERIEILIRYRK